MSVLTRKEKLMEILAVVLILILGIVFNRVFNSPQSDSSAAAHENRPSVQQSPAVDQPAPGVNRCPADALINSPYYSKYKTAFDLIWYNGKQPKYKIDWLLQSLNMGRELEDFGSYVLKSMENELPYFCETEYEFDKFYDSDKPVTLGSIDGMMELCFFYHETSRDAHPAKRKYWQQRLRELALSGSLEAKGALCSSFAKMVFSEDEVNESKEIYEAELLNLAKSGNASAQLAVGKYLSPHNSKESIAWLTQSANHGLSDAWYQLSKIYESQIILDANGKVRQTPLPENETQSLERRIAESIYKGAEADNGVMAARCQYWVGTYYEDGNSILPKDIEKAKYWYQKSLENGETKARYEIERINEHPEWY